MRDVEEITSMEQLKYKNSLPTSKTNPNNITEPNKSTVWSTLIKQLIQYNYNYTKFKYLFCVISIVIEIKKIDFGINQKVKFNEKKCVFIILKNIHT